VKQGQRIPEQRKENYGKGSNRKVKIKEKERNESEITHAQILK
jgi:hypothetical protein